MPFGATPSGRYMPTPGGRITPTRDRIFISACADITGRPFTVNMPCMNSVLEVRCTTLPRASMNMPRLAGARKCVSICSDTHFWRPDASHAMLLNA